MLHVSSFKLLIYFDLLPKKQLAGSIEEGQKNIFQVAIASFSTDQSANEMANEKIAKGKLLLV